VRVAKLYYVEHGAGKRNPRSAERMVVAMRKDDSSPFKFVEMLIVLAGYGLLIWGLYETVWWMVSY
jgi:hypothetical protein